MSKRTEFYEQYMASEAWQERRRKALDRADHRCQICNGTDRLDVHHRTYERLGRERLDDLTVLCRGCHKLHHRKLEAGRRGTERQSLPPSHLIGPDPHLLSLLHYNRDLVEEAAEEVSPWDFLHETWREVFGQLVADPQSTPDSWGLSPEQRAEWEHIIEDEPEGEPKRVLSMCLNTLRARRRQNEHDALRKELRGASQARKREILEQIAELRRSTSGSWNTIKRKKPRRDDP